MTLIKETIRLDNKIIENVEQYNIANNINNKQEAYRRLILSGLMNETKFDKNKAISLEREILIELKLLKNMLIEGEVVSQSKTLELNDKIAQAVGKMNIFKEL
jgi:hypothetical protein